MHKLCTLKEIVPGSVIELPKEYQSRDGETAIVMGLEYASDNQSIRTELLRSDNLGLISTALPSLHEDTELAVTEDCALKNEALKQFVTNKVKLPSLGLSMGADPEIFVEHGDGTIFPAWEFMPDENAALAEAKQWLAQVWRYNYNGVQMNTPGITWNMPSEMGCPQRVPAYWDGAQAEFAPWAKTCLESLHFGTRVGLRSVIEYARLKDPSARLTLKNVVELPEVVRMAAADKYIQFRCSSSLNVYEDLGAEIPDAREYKYRCSGGHIHLGYTRAFTAPGIESLVRGLDGVLGVAGVSLAAGIDDPERRKSYGRAGEFRLPKHGLEYRVLSNFWLCHPAIAMLVFELTRGVARLAESGLFNLCWDAQEEEIRAVINGCDVDGARKILARNAPVLKGLLHGLWVPSWSRQADIIAKMEKAAFDVIMQGIGAVIENPFDVEGNWKLSEQDWKQHLRGQGESWISLVKSL